MGEPPVVYFCIATNCCSLLLGATEGKNLWAILHAKSNSATNTSCNGTEVLADEASFTMLPQRGPRPQRLSTCDRSGNLALKPASMRATLLERVVSVRVLPQVIAQTREQISGYRRLDLGFFAQQRQGFFDERVGCDPMFLAQDWNRAVLDELIGPSDPDYWRIDHLRVQMLHHSTAKTVVQNMVFNRAHDFHAAREKFESASIHWFDPARID